MFRGTIAIVALATFCGLFSPVSSLECESDLDCPGNLDCTRVGLFRKRCAPVTCAKGAAQAVLDSGFDSKKYIGNLLRTTGLKRSDFLSLGESENELLAKAMNSTPPPKEVFDANLTKCLNPERRLEASQTQNHRTLQSSDTETWFGLQWSGAALFSYFGKATWKTIEGDGFFEDDLRYEFLQNCVGFLLGGDVGLDILFQIYTSTNDNVAAFPRDEDTQYVPVITVGPFGVQVGWFEGGDPDDLTMTEVTFGPSLGAALGGFSQCFADLESREV